ncbi:MAG: glycosyltransferase family 4 protein [Bacteroidia bacterium]
MKVLHVINSMLIGGAEKLLKDTIIGINEQFPAIKQHLITLYGGGEQLDSITSIIKYKNLFAQPQTFLKKVFQLRAYILENKIDIVHAHLYDAIILSRYAIPSKVKLIYTYHSGTYAPSSYDYSITRKIIDQFSYRRKHTAIFVSESVKKEILMGVNITGPSIVLHNFVSSDFKNKYQYKSDSCLNLISIGNLKQVKNHEHSIRVLMKLKDYNVKLDIYGSGILHDELKNLILETSANVNIITDTIITSDTLSKYDAFFMSSFQEGMSIALLEAIASGLPAVLSNIPSFIETAKDAAVYFDNTNPEQAADLLLKLYNNKQLLNNLSEKSRILSDIYKLDVYLKKLVALYSN